MPFAAAFDVAVCFGALGHIRKREQTPFIAAVSQVLKPGGRFAFVTSDMPSWHSARYWRLRGFNAAMHVRNLLSPPFVMYYLTFILPHVVDRLVAAGFTVVVQDELFTGQFRDLKLIIATKPSEDQQLPHTSAGRCPRAGDSAS
jgi:SAM-dependent methyltransferase